MISLENAYTNYLCRKYIVVSTLSLNNDIEKFYGVSCDSIFATDNFLNIDEFSKMAINAKAIYYKPKFGFLGNIELLKTFCKKNNIILIEDFTENFSANKIIDGKSLYAGMFGDVSICLINDTYFYATDDEKLAKYLRAVAPPPTDLQKKNLIDFLFEAEDQKRQKRIAVANYMALFAYTGLSHFLKPIDEDEGEIASYPVFAVTAEKSNDIFQFLMQKDIQIGLWNNLLLLPINVTKDVMRHIMDLIAKFYKEAIM